MRRFMQEENDQDCKKTIGSGIMEQKIQTPHVSDKIYWEMNNVLFILWWMNSLWVNRFLLKLTRVCLV